VPRASRTVAITVEGRSIGALEAVVLANDPFLHGGSLLEAVSGTGLRPTCAFSPPLGLGRFAYASLSSEAVLEKGSQREFSPIFCAYSRGASHSRTDDGARSATP